VALRRTLQFFRVVRPVPRLNRLVFAGITLASGGVLLASHDSEMRALLPVLVLQMFTVSTGFIRDARRGHFDVLLTSGVARWEAATVYWGLAALPGISSWWALALIDLAVHGHTGLLRPGSVAAVASVSTIPWATTVPLGRFTGSSGWLLALAIVAGLCAPDVEPSSRTEAGQIVEQVIRRPGFAEPFDIAQGKQARLQDRQFPAEQVWIRRTGESQDFGVLAFLLFPARLVGEPLRGNTVPILTVVALAVFGMGSATAWIATTDVALETGQ